MKSYLYYVLYNTNFSRGGNFRYIRELGFCAKFYPLRMEYREIFHPRNLPPAKFSSPRK